MKNLKYIFLLLIFLFNINNVLNGIIIINETTKRINITSSLFQDKRTIQAGETIEVRSPEPGARNHLNFPVIDAQICLFILINPEDRIPTEIKFIEENGRIHKIIEYETQEENQTPGCSIQ